MVFFQYVSVVVASLEDVVSQYSLISGFEDL